MNDLPGSPSDAGTQPTTTPNSSVGNTGSLHKESEIGGIQNGESSPLRDVGAQEVELSAEVSGAGVRVQPTTVAIPPKVQQMGVKPSGQSVAVGSGGSVTLPLTDDQIAQGLHQSVTSSWRWLAEWCVRKLKQLHKTFRKESTNKQIYK